ncbi:MAG: uracil-DNA glycosylase [Anaerolineales bacterium]|jgi:uracil-DNA glycosylase family 4
MASLNPEWDQLNQTILACRKCPRLVSWREQVARTKRRAFRDWTYWGKPVSGFGDREARILAVGLAPGAHGSNRTGRMFTGDASGEFLYAALHRAGLASQPTSTEREDGLSLQRVFISALCRCAPPENKPTTQEITNCLPFLQREMDWLPRLQVLVALGRMAFDQILRLYRDRGFETSRLAFAHGARYPLGDGLPWLIASYHPSRQNTQTGRLTRPMFDRIWKEAKALL